MTLKKHPIDPRFETLDDFARALETAFTVERTARETRLDLEKKIAEIVGEADIPITISCDDYDVIVQSNTKRAADPLAIPLVIDALGSDIASDLFPLRHTLNLEGYLNLRDSDPASFAIANKAVKLQHAPATVRAVRRLPR